jgi:hypothetical protein
MAKFKQEYENGVQINTLVFRGIEFSFTMAERADGLVSSDKPCFSAQIEEAFSDMTSEILNDEIDVDMIDSSTHEDEVFEILELLEEYE